MQVALINHMPKLRTIFFVFVALISTQCFAQFKSGNDLLSKLESDDSRDRVAALNYIMGAVDADAYHRDMLTYLKGAKDVFLYKFYCVPVGATSRQVSDIVGSYLKIHPENRQISASILMNTALIGVWPCDDNPK